MTAARSCSDPQAGGAAQSIGAFISLHTRCSSPPPSPRTCCGYREAGARRIWLGLVGTATATVYFGWHYVLDDLGGDPGRRCCPSRPGTRPHRRPAAATRVRWRIPDAASAASMRPSATTRPSPPGAAAVRAPPPAALPWRRCSPARSSRSRTFVAALIADRTRRASVPRPRPRGRAVPRARRRGRRAARRDSTSRCRAGRARRRRPARGDARRPPRALDARARAIAVGHRARELLRQLPGLPQPQGRRAVAAARRPVRRPARPTSTARCSSATTRPRCCTPSRDRRRDAPSCRPSTRRSSSSCRSRWVALVFSPSCAEPVLRDGAVDQLGPRRGDVLPDPGARARSTPTRVVRRAAAHRGDAPAGRCCSTTASRSFTTRSRRRRRRSPRSRRCTSR